MLLNEDRGIFNSTSSNCCRYALQPFFFDVTRLVTMDVLPVPADPTIRLTKFLLHNELSILELITSSHNISGKSAEKFLFLISVIIYLTKHYIYFWLLVVFTSLHRGRVLLPSRTWKALGLSCLDFCFLLCHS